MFLGSKYLQKPGVWKPRVSEFFWNFAGIFGKKNTRTKNITHIRSCQIWISKNMPWVNNKQTFGNNIQGGLYLLIPPTSVFLCVLGRWTEDSVISWSQDAFPPLSLVMLRLLVGCGGLLLAYLGAKAFLHFRELRYSKRWHFRLMIFIDISGCFKILGLTTHPKPHPKPIKTLMVGEFKRSQKMVGRSTDWSGRLLAWRRYKSPWRTVRQSGSGWAEGVFLFPQQLGVVITRSILETFFLTHKRQKNPLTGRWHQCLLKSEKIRWWWGVSEGCVRIPSSKPTVLPLKMDSWKTNLNFLGWLIFRGCFFGIFLQFFARAIWFPCEETLILCVIGWMLGNVKLGDGWL